MFVAAPPGADEHALAGDSSVCCLNAEQVSLAIQAAGAAVGINSKLLSSYCCRKGMATAAVNGKEDPVKIVATTLHHMNLDTTLKHYVDACGQKDSFQVVHSSLGRICLGLLAAARPHNAWQRGLVGGYG